LQAFLASGAFSFYRFRQRKSMPRIAPESGAILFFCYNSGGISFKEKA